MRWASRIAALAARLHAATYQLLVLLAEFDARNGWNTGFLSCVPRTTRVGGTGLAHRHRPGRRAREGARGPRPARAAARE